MKSLGLWIRCLPIALLAMFGSTVLVVLNPGYFWDDWVWLFHNAAENIQIGKELGVWWGGYLTTIINGLPSPSIAMRVTALIAWISTGAIVALMLHRYARVTRMSAFQFFLIYCATHVAMIRFLTSVALYNVYIAAFWLGVAILLGARRRSPLLRWVALALLFFSFYLNSLIVLYALLLALLVLGEIQRSLNFQRTLRAAGWIELAALRGAVHTFWSQSKPVLRDFARQNVSLLALPIVFILVKRLTTAKSQLYGSYNSIDAHLVLSAIGTSFTLIRPVLRDFFAIGLRTVPPVGLIAATLICFGLLRLLPRRSMRTPWRDIGLHLALGILFFAAAAYPYVVVGKTPELMSFYDARNILPAVAAIDLILLALIDTLDRAFARVPLLQRYGRDLVLAYVLATSISAGIMTGINLWHDWLRQTATIAYLRDHRDQLRDDRTFVFDDKTRSSRIGDRTIWNYEYTGNLISAYGGRDHFGLSVSEYVQWPKNVALITDKTLRRRFNIRDYDFRKPHVIVSMEDGPVPLTAARVLPLVYEYLLGNAAWQTDAAQYFVLSTAQEYIEADARAAEMFDMAAALAAYRRDHGCYPTTVAGTPCGAAQHALFDNGNVGPRPVVGDIPGLFPTYMARPDTMRVHFGQPNYLYFSDGDDYKLVYSDASDLPYARQSHPALIDTKNLGYGVWTLGASAW
ncbi:hypothetical protein [Trinickia diaoshuihuensis]|uniref:hypothetical protein n=1 Tax=Trinickia diaoshuihuensis TaxID=2292265 RepID=UPI0013C2F0CA|nr:hypothetical protein [Trinickia diaoshuihuensis]